MIIYFRITKIVMAHVFKNCESVIEICACKRLANFVLACIKKKVDPHPLMLPGNVSNDESKVQETWLCDVVS